MPTEPAKIFKERELTRHDKEILEKLNSLCFDQGGCRMIQKKLENVNPGESAFASALLRSMLPYFDKAACNQFGNYLCQRVIEVSTEDEIKDIVYAVQPNLIDMSFSQHGTRVVQILLESIAAYWHKNKTLQYEMLAIVEEFNQDALAMCMHTNGNHVTQTLLNQFRASDQPGDADIEGTEDCQQFTNFVFEACMTWPVEIGTHKQGCCVMQRCLEKGRLC